MEPYPVQLHGDADAFGLSMTNRRMAAGSYCSGAVPSWTTAPGSRSEMFLERGIVFSHETVHEWEAKLTPVLTTEIRQRRHGRGGAGPPILVH
jgi:hypothetical protein